MLRNNLRKKIAEEQDAAFRSQIQNFVDNLLADRNAMREQLQLAQEKLGKFICSFVKISIIKSIWV